MTNDLIIKLLRAERVADPDPIIVAAIQSEIESAVEDPGTPPVDRNPSRTAAKIYDAYVSQFQNPTAARAHALNRIAEFQKHSQQVSRLEHELEHARTEQDTITKSKSRLIVVEGELNHVDGGLHEIQQALSTCSPEAREELIEVSASNFLDGQPNFSSGYADPHARQRHYSALELLVFSEQRKLVLNRAIQKLTAKRDLLVEESKQLAKVLEKGSK